MRKFVSTSMIWWPMSTPLSALNFKSVHTSSPFSSVNALHLHSLISIFCKVYFKNPLKTTSWKILSGYFCFCGNAGGLTLRTAWFCLLFRLNLSLSSRSGPGHHHNLHAYLSVGGDSSNTRWRECYRWVTLSLSEGAKRPSHSPLARFCRSSVTQNASPNFIQIFTTLFQILSPLSPHIFPHSKYFSKAKTEKKSRPE